jgi:hypothetical protein
MDQNGDFMSKVVDANGCMMIDEEDITVIVIKKTGKNSMRETLNIAIDLIREET